jgi:hypothetical protein
MFKKVCRYFCIGANLLSQKEMGPMITIAPIAHHTPTITSCHSLNAIMSQSKNTSFWANTVIKLSVVGVILFSLIVVLTPIVQFLGCVTIASSERRNGSFWIHMWKLVFWELAYKLSGWNFRRWSERLCGSVSTPYTPWFEHFITRHSLAFLLRTEFEDRPFRVKYVVNKATLRQCYITVFVFPLSSFYQCFMLAHSSSPTLCSLANKHRWLYRVHPDVFRIVQNNQDNNHLTHSLYYELGYMFQTIR